MEDTLTEDKPEGTVVVETDPKPSAKPSKAVRRSKWITSIGDDLVTRTPTKYRRDLPVGNYVVMFNPHPPYYGFFLRPTDEFHMPGKLYGDPGSQVDRYINTFFARRRSTGILLAGQKGSGKTLTAQLLCMRIGIPVLQVSSAYTGDDFHTFINEVPGDCVVLFDEFEKTFRAKEEQESLLTLLDGNYKARRLFMLTSNTPDVVEWLRNRPGRIFYRRVYDRLEESVISEFIDDNLKKPEDKEDLMRVIRILDNVNMDMVSSIVEEMNRYGEAAPDAVKHMNLEIDASRYDWRITAKGVQFPLETMFNRPHPLAINDEEDDGEFSIMVHFDCASKTVMDRFDWDKARKEAGDDPDMRRIALDLLAKLKEQSPAEVERHSEQFWMQNCLETATNERYKRIGVELAVRSDDFTLASDGTYKAVPSMAGARPVDMAHGLLKSFGLRYDGDDPVEHVMEILGLEITAARYRPAKSAYNW